MFVIQCKAITASSRVCALMICLIFFLIPGNLVAAATLPDPTPAPAYEETSITLSVKDLGNVEMPGIIVKQGLYLSVTDLFNFLQIKNTSSQKMDSVFGSILNSKDFFLIDHKSGSITYRNKTTRLGKDDLIVTPDGAFLQEALFGKVFGLNIKFHFRDLSADLIAGMELPALKEMRLEQMRQNIRRLHGNPHADTTIGRNRPAFHFGMAEWGFVTSNGINGGHDNRVTLGLGAVVAGGETNLGLYVHNAEKITEKQQFYQWRYVNNENQFIRQITLGKIAVNSISSIYNQVVGVQLTNAPTIYRKSYGTYPTSGFTEPDWVVELFVNSELVDYKKADESGFYNFDIPLVFGNSNIQLKFYGPFGEERSKELIISIPFNFLPYHETQYVASAGFVEDSARSKFFRTSIGYGLNHAATIGAGVEYLSSVTSGKTMPFVNASVRLNSQLLFSADYVYSVRGKAVLDYRLPKDLLIELNYTHYALGQTAINYNYREERKVMLSMPYHSSLYTIYSRLTLDQIVLPRNKYLMADYLISASKGRTSLTMTTFANIYQGTAPYYYSTVALSYRLKNGLVFTPSAQYDYNHKQVISARLAIEKPVFRRGYFNFSVDRTFTSKLTSAFAGLRYEFGFAQTSTDIRTYGRAVYLEEAANGSFIVDKKQKLVMPYNRAVVGRAALAISCFLDLNNNGIKDKGEPRVDGLKIRLNAGRVTYSKKDSTCRIFDLEPYVRYYVELEPGFQNISWRLKAKTLSIMADPNQIKTIEVPVQVLGEVSGMVNRTVEGEDKGVGRMVLNVFNLRSVLVGRTVTESDGSYTFLGLQPGRYTVHIDEAQMSRLGLIGVPEYHVIEIAQELNGDVVEKIDFTVHAGKRSVAKLKFLAKIAAEVPDGMVSTRVARNSKEKFKQIVIQTVSFGSKEVALEVQNMLQKALHKPVTVFFEGQYFKLRISDLNNMEQAYRIRYNLGGLGYYGIILHSSETITSPAP